MFTGGQFLNERTVPILTIYCMVPCKVSQMDRYVVKNGAREVPERREFAVWGGSGVSAML